MKPTTRELAKLVAARHPMNPPTKQKAEPLALPLYVEDHGPHCANAIQVELYTGTLGDYQLVASMEHGNARVAKRQAEYIVTACNAFPVLVDALEAAWNDYDNGRLTVSTREQVRHALALARGEKGHCE